MVCNTFKRVPCLCMLEQHQSYCNYSWKWKKKQPTNQTQRNTKLCWWCFLFVLYTIIFLWRGSISPKFGVQCHLCNVDSVAVGDVFFTLEHVLLQLNVGFLKWNTFLLKFSRQIKFFFILWLCFLYEHLEKDNLGYAPDWPEIGMMGE